MSKSAKELRVSRERPDEVRIRPCRAPFGRARSCPPTRPRRPSARSCAGSRRACAGLVVDDGSTDADGSARRRRPGPRSCGCPANGGKGTALRAGLARSCASRRDARRLRGRRRPARSGRPAAAARGGARRATTSSSGRAWRTSTRFPAYRLPDQRDRQPDPLADDGHEVEDAQSGYRVVVGGLLRRLDLNARGYIIETEILLKAAPPRAAVPPRARCGRSTAGRRTTGRSGTPGSSPGARCTTKCSRWTEAAARRCPDES